MQTEPGDAAIALHEAVAPQVRRAVVEAGKAPNRWDRIGGSARKAAVALLLAACATAHSAGVDQGREETAAARIEALEPHHLSMQTQFYVESIERIIEIVGEELISLPEAMFWVIEPAKKSEACALISDYAIFRSTMSRVMHEAAFGREVMKYLLKAAIVEMSGFEMRRGRQWTEEEETHIVEVGLKRAKKTNERFDAILEKYKQCVDEDAVTIHGFAFTDGYADTRRELMARDLYRGLMPFVQWVRENIRSPRDEKAKEAIEHFEELVESMKRKYLIEASTPPS